MAKLRHKLFNSKANKIIFEGIQQIILSGIERFNLYTKYKQKVNGREIIE